MRIAAADRILSIEEPQASGPNWELSRNAFVLRVPGLAAFGVRDGREISYATEPGVNVPDVVPFLVGSVFGILLHQRGVLVLHASAVNVGGRAVLFCGRSGFGKSTLAAALNQRGYPMLLDDICAIDTSQGAPLALPDGRWLKLWAQSIERLGLGDRRRGAVRPGLQKHHVEPPGGAALWPLPVGLIYELTGAHPGEAEGIRPVHAADAVRLLTRNAYRPAVVRESGLRRAYFEQCAALSTQARAYQLVRAETLSELDASLGLLEGHWRELGLLAASQ